ncbi:MAG: SUMF1/EgtB/PvdO family nonheme iron enzyme [Alphaproteobacteria bacterium]|nr:SUMF1/EgtB/PvdO family nonheme iron enzyme [Alphaproteobacteria bacterium]
MAGSWTTRIEDLTRASLARAVGELAAWADEAVAAIASGQMGADDQDRLRALCVAMVEGDEGNARARLGAGEVLAALGDPRLRTPADPDYWVTLTLGSGDPFAIGRFPVTNQEFRAWVEAGGYDDRAAWSDDGWAWKEETADTWPSLAARDSVRAFVVANQPVVGVSWFEADAYARGVGARLPRWYERVWAVRGAEKRPYPWGDPFREGYANTKEEVLERPCAVGLYVRDVTPEGVHDLAGNAAEWTGEEAGEERLLHPGSYDQPSLASWAKALTSAAPSARWGALGFRLARDVEA